MRKAILASMFLTVALVAFGQHGTTQIGGKAGANLKSKPKAKPKPKAASTSKVFFDPCGVRYATDDDYFSADEWVLLGESSDDHFWYNQVKVACDSQSGILKAWVKEVHKKTDHQYALVQYELKCKTNQMRIGSLIEYDKDGKVLARDNHNDPWQDSIPESAGEEILHTICRQP